MSTILTPDRVIEGALAVLPYCAGRGKKPEAVIGDALMIGRLWAHAIDSGKAVHGSMFELVKELADIRQAETIKFQEALGTHSAAAAEPVSESDSNEETIDVSQPAELSV